MIRKPAPLEYSALMEYAVKTVAGRGLSISELRRKLGRRAAKREDVDRVLTALKDAGALNDQQFAESFAASRLENRGFGSMRVLRDLRAKQVSSTIAEDAVTSAYSETDEMTLIESYVAKKFRGKDLPVYLAEEKNLASAFRKLRMAGFSSGNSIRALRKYSKRAEELEDTESES